MQITVDCGCHLVHMLWAVDNPEMLHMVVAGYLRIVDCPIDNGLLANLADLAAFYVEQP